MEIPEGRWLKLPRRGRTWLTELDRASGCARDRAAARRRLHRHAHLVPAVHQLAERYRVVVFDQRWHGRGIISESFSLHDCADDVAAVITELGLDEPIVAGYSMGSVIAQRVWRQHPDLVGGLVLAATTDHFRTNGRERRLPRRAWSSAWARCATLSKSRTVRRASRSTAEALDIGPTDIGQWALEEWRSTSPWAVAQAVAVARAAPLDARGCPGSTYPRRWWSPSTTG